MASRLEGLRHLRIHFKSPLLGRKWLPDWRGYDTTSTFLVLTIAVENGFQTGGVTTECVNDVFEFSRKWLPDWRGYDLSNIKQQTHKMIVENGFQTGGVTTTIPTTSSTGILCLSKMASRLEGLRPMVILLILICRVENGFQTGGVTTNAYSFLFG